MRTYSLIKLVCDCMSTTAVAIEQGSDNKLIETACNHISQIVADFGNHCPEISEMALEAIKKDLEDHLRNLIHLDN